MQLWAEAIDDIPDNSSLRLVLVQYYSFNFVGLTWYK